MNQHLLYVTSKEFERFCIEPSKTVDLLYGKHDIVLIIVLYVVARALWIEPIRRSQ